MADIVEIVPGSPGAQLGLESGDQIMAINDRKINDYIDYRYEIADSNLLLDIKKKNGQEVKLNVEKSYGQDLGLRFNGIIFDNLMNCQNRCIFCFVDQLPGGVRKSLKIKDDDYRFSFLQGSYITLTNLKQEDYKRIINLRLSPLYISIHTTNSQLRSRMLRNSTAGKIKQQLSKLIEGGICFHGQIVLCPGYNDQHELDKTLSDLMKFYPSLLSLGIVPVGLTAYSDNDLSPYNPEGAARVLKQIRKWQEIYRQELGHNIIYAADEFYLRGNEGIPNFVNYHDFPQYENGIGLVRSLWHEFENIKMELPSELPRKKMAILTAKLGIKALKPIIKELNQNRGTDIELISVSNTFFGDNVTVTGLLTGKDIIKALTELKTPDILILPGIMLNDQGLFLDDMEPDQLQKKFPRKEFIYCDSLQELIEVILNE